MKRFFITISLILACALLFCVGLGVILALAPGSRIFGIEYVSAQVGNADIIEEWSEYVDGDIYINTKEIPIIINFEPYGTTKVQFSQHFSGYTTGGFRVPSAEIEKDANGINITTNEIEKFLIGSNRDYYLTLTLPSSWGVSGRHSIYVNGNSSQVTINADERITLNFVQLSLQSKGEVNFNCNFDVRDLTIYSPKNLVLDENLMAQNITAQSHSGNITVNYSIIGDFTATTVSGNVKFVSCNNATIETSSGQVSGIDDGCIIYGKTYIKTRGGSVKIKSMNGLGEENNVTTNAGTVNIETMLKGTITSPRGKITISNLLEVTIVGGTNTITIGAVGNSVNIESKRGTVNVGSLSEGKVANNVTVSTTSGSINASNTKGVVSLTTRSGNVKLNNTSASDINIASGKEVIATGLCGSVKISGNGEINLAFSKFSDDVEIVGNSKCRNINVSIEDKTYSQVNYNLSTTSKNGGIAKVFAGNAIAFEGVTLASEVSLLANKTLNINATKCKINVYFKV